MMKKIVKSRKKDEDADDFSPMSRLPDEIILQILNKLIDLKTLCCCYLVSRRFSSIVLQVDAIAFIAPLINPNKNTLGDGDDCGFLWNLLINAAAKNSPSFLHGMIFASSNRLHPIISSFDNESFPFLSAITFLFKFKGVKSLSMEIPCCSRQKSIDNHRVFKWKVNVGNQIESFIYLSPDSVCNKDEFLLNENGEEEEEMDLLNVLAKPNLDIAYQCLKESVVWHNMVLYLVKGLPKLEKVSITDSGRRGRLSLSGEKLSEVKGFVHSASETVLISFEKPDIMSKCYIPVLNLPVSGYVMKGVNVIVMETKDLQCGKDGLMNNNDDGFEGKEEAAYTEAVMEILEKHKDRMRIL